MKYLYLKTIGTIKQGILEDLIGSLDFLPVKIIKKKDYPLFAFESKRNQYYAKKIIEHLILNIPADCEKLIAITDIDLCTPVLTFVFGEAQLGGTAAIVSRNRLKQEFYSFPVNNGLLVERLLKVCLHELGHCYGLVHCSNSKCVMYLSNNIINLDNKGKKFCVKCEEFFDKRIRKEKHG